MLQAILFDLDGTLLMHDYDVFIPRFMGLVASSLSARFPGYDLPSLILQSTMIMLQNDGSRTNAELFWSDFGPRFEKPREEVEAIFMDFYRNDFPSLGAGFDPAPEAAPLVAACSGRGLRVALATNPIFPRLAIDERLRWAGIDPGLFHVVTSYEWMRFCKPNPGYFSQIAGELGVAPADCLMVGNDVGQDLLPAAAVGMRTCLLDNSFRVLSSGPAGFTPDYACRLNQVLDLAIA
jgi:FMN phosphatase YigB (HAD superfamily)